MSALDPRNNQVLKSSEHTSSPVRVLQFHMNKHYLFQFGPSPILSVMTPVITHTQRF